MSLLINAKEDAEARALDAYFAKRNDLVATVSQAFFRLAAKATGGHPNFQYSLVSVLIVQ